MVPDLRSSLLPTLLMSPARIAQRQPRGTFDHLLFHLRQQATGRPQSETARRHQIYTHPPHSATILANNFLFSMWRWISFTLASKEP